MITRRLIITCEECGEVQHFNASSEIEVDKIYSEFICPNRCDRKYYSYITIGEIHINPDNHVVEKAVSTSNS